MMVLTSSPANVKVTSHFHLPSGPVPGSSERNRCRRSRCSSIHPKAARQIAIGSARDYEKDQQNGDVSHAVILSNVHSRRQAADLAAILKPMCLTSSRPDAEATHPKGAE